MRLTSEVFVSALVRRVFADGGFAAIERRGSPEAGSVFIVVRDRDGAISLYEPAPQSSYDDGRPEDRLFQRSQCFDVASIDRRFASEIRFDPDFWVVELEPAHSSIEDLFTVTG